MPRFSLCPKARTNLSEEETLDRLGKPKRIKMPCRNWAQNCKSEENEFPKSTPSPHMCATYIKAGTYKSACSGYGLLELQLGRSSVCIMCYEILYNVQTSRCLTSEEPNLVDSRYSVWLCIALIYWRLAVITSGLPYIRMLLSSSWKLSLSQSIATDHYGCSIVSSYSVFLFNVYSSRFDLSQIHSSGQKRQCWYALVQW